MLKFHLIIYIVESSLKLLNSYSFPIVSEAVCKEYEQLKHQYDVETNAMHKAMQQASQVTIFMII